MSSNKPAINEFPIAIEDIPDHPDNSLDDKERATLTKRIKELLKKNNAKIVAHYYTDSDLQLLADGTGGYVSDSLDMARFGYESEAETLIVCGVRFMGETAKILSPKKRILMPDLNANCSLDLGCPPKEFGEFCDAHPDRTVVVYANTSAAVKARADWMVTSGSAVEVINHLQEKDERIIWAPDKYLGEYVQKRSGADMLLWQSACIVHEEFKGKELADLIKQHPEAKVLVHPESPASVVAQADVVSSTTGIIKAAVEMDADTFIVATDNGIFHKMAEAAPGKTFIEAPTAGKGATCKSCAHCPWMAMNSLKKLCNTLEALDDDDQGNRNGRKEIMGNEVFVDADIIERAQRPITRLLEFAEQRKQIIYGNNDA